LLFSTQKYVLFVGDFNAHHSDWEDQRTDLQGEYISRACEDYYLVIMNDGSPTFIYAPNVSSSTIDLTIASRPLAILANQVTIQDLYGSDHYPVKITLYNTYPSVYRYSFKCRLSSPQLLVVQDWLVLNASKLREELSSKTELTLVINLKDFVRFSMKLSQ